MKFCFHGDLEDFEAFVTDLHLPTWVHQLPNGIYQVRFFNRANMNWSSTSKRLWFDGDPAGCRYLEEEIERYSALEHFPQFTYRT